MCCGDFRQIPPVIPGGGRSAIVEASMKFSPLWPLFVKRNLTHPQRDTSDVEYSQFIDRIGDGVVDSEYSIQSDSHLMKLELMEVTANEDEAIKAIFPDVNDTHLCSKRAIITGTNVVVDELNAKILRRMDGEETTVHSVTRLASDDCTRLSNFLTEEFLQSLKSPGVPIHHLKLKLNCLCLVMRNISIEDRVMNNTKVIVRDISRKFVTVETLLEHREFSSLGSCFASRCPGVE